MLRELRASNVRAVLFGGTLRSLLTSRIYHARPGRPRDVDVVVSGTRLEELEETLGPSVVRRTRFGGLHLNRDGWQFDVWPLERTWALQKDAVTDADFSILPSTTTLNLEAIAVDAWPAHGHSRQLFSGDDQFFEGILTRTVELNRLDNPFPQLTVVRALVLTTDLGFRVGPRLAAEIALTGGRLTSVEFDGLQRSHYGHVRLNGHILSALTAFIANRFDGSHSVDLPRVGQLSFWPLNDVPPGAQPSNRRS